MSEKKDDCILKQPTSQQTIYKSTQQTTFHTEDEVRNLYAHHFNIAQQSGYFNSANASKKSKNSKRKINMHSKTYSLAIKCYAEQLAFSEEDTYNAIRNIDKSEMQVQCIKHYRDKTTDGIWVTSDVKPHYHIIVRMTNRKKCMRVFDILVKLHIVFRASLDDDLIEHNALETVRNYTQYSMYLTHETEESINEAKELYSIDEIVSNMSIDEIKKIREGYVRLCANKKLTNEDLITIDEMFFSTGYDLLDFEKMYNDLPFHVRSNAKIRTFKESYERGLDKRIKKCETLIRCCIFVEGQANVGKTYASREALRLTNHSNILTVGGGGTGKFDKLTASTEAILIDDDTCSNLLNMSDNFICRAYRRGSNNPVWAGNMLVVTSNHSFPEWLQLCKLDVRLTYYNCSHCFVLGDTAKAVMTRFFICKVVYDDALGCNRLALLRPSTRGTVDEQQARLQMFLDFKRHFDATMSKYVPSRNAVDYSKYVDDKYASDLRLIVNA